MFLMIKTPMIQDHQRLDMPSSRKWVRLKSILVYGFSGVPKKEGVIEGKKLVL